MEKSELFFETIIKFGQYLVEINGEENLRIIIKRKDCLTLSFCCATKFKNPNLQKGGFSDSGSKFKCEDKNNVLTVFLFSPREKTPIFRIPINFITTIISLTKDDFNLIPDGLDLSCWIELLYSFGAYGYFEVIDGNCRTKSSFPNYSQEDSKILSAWAILENTGVRLSEEKENLLCSQFANAIKNNLHSIIGNYERELAKRKARSSYISSPDDEPVFLFAEGGYSKAITKNGVNLFDSYGREGQEKENLETMKKSIAEDYWQYRVVIAEKDNPEVFSFIDQFILLEEEKFKRNISFLKIVKEKWEGKSSPKGWTLLYAD